MNNNEFDKKITDIVAEEHIPFNEDNWADMQQRLDKKPSRRLLLMLPILYKPFAAAAGVLLLAGAAYFFITGNDNAVSVPIATTQKTIVEPQSPSALQGDTLQKESTVIPTHTPVAPVWAGQQKNKAIVDTAQPEIIAHTTTEDTNLQEENIAVTPPKQSPHKPNISLSDYYPETGNDETIHNKTAFGVNTGLAVNTPNNSFSAGLVVKNMLTDNISIRTALNFVQGHQDVLVKHIEITQEPVGISTDTGMVEILETTITERYEEYSRNLPYIQFNPGISVRVFKKLHCAVGADIQQLIISQNTLDTLNKHLEETGKKVAKTDPGVTLNMNYHITPKIGLGVSYRNSLTGVAAGNVEYIKRNYFLVQLQYLFNAE